MSKQINNKRILVVDDDSDILSLIGHIYESEGYLVDLATNGQEALDFLNASSELPAFILLDLMMPFLDGLGFMKEADKVPELAKLPIVVMSASGEREVMKKGIDTQKYIKKPIDLDTLIQVAHLHCANGSAPAQL